MFQFYFRIGIEHTDVLREWSRPRSWNILADLRRLDRLPGSHHQRIQAQTLNMTFPVDEVVVFFLLILIPDDIHLSRIFHLCFTWIHKQNARNIARDVECIHRSFLGIRDITNNEVRQMCCHKNKCSHFRIIALREIQKTDRHCINITELNIDRQRLSPLYYINWSTYVSPPYPMLQLEIAFNKLSIR